MVDSRRVRFTKTATPRPIRAAARQVGLLGTLLREPARLAPACRAAIKGGTTDKAAFHCGYCGLRRRGFNGRPIPAALYWHSAMTVARQKWHGLARFACRGLGVFRDACAPLPWTSASRWMASSRRLDRGAAWWWWAQPSTLHLRVNFVIKCDFCFKIAFFDGPHPSRIAAGARQPRVGDAAFNRIRRLAGSAPPPLLAPY